MSDPSLGVFLYMQVWGYPGICAEKMKTSSYSVGAEVPVKKQVFSNFFQWIVIIVVDVMHDTFTFATYKKNTFSKIHRTIHFSLLLFHSLNYFYSRAHSFYDTHSCGICLCLFCFY